MTDVTTPLEYANPLADKGVCPLCQERPTWKKSIYGHAVCKKCFYRFANRRQLGYLVDSLVFIIPMAIVVFTIDWLILMAGASATVMYLLNLPVAVGLACLFYLKDGFNGQSLGKRLCDIQVLDNQTDAPIGFGQSFKRHVVFLWSSIPFVGRIVGLVLVIVAAVQVGKGPRIGDRFANTRAIWKRFAHSPVFGGNALRCEKCEYDLQGNVSGVCPECGQPLSPRNQSLLAASTAVPVAPV